MDALQQQFPANDFAILAVVLALPAIGAFVNGVFGKRLGKEGVRLMALSAIGGSFIASLLTFLMLPSPDAAGSDGKLYWTAWEWLSFGGRAGRPIDIPVKFSVDAMTATMMLVVTGIGFLIHLYSSEYMKKDPGYYRFFAYLNLFCFSMLVLIMGDNLPILFVGWEGVGLCSYLLIGFWFTEEKNAIAGKKAFIVNRIGDFGLLLAMAMLIYYCGKLDWAGLESSTSGLFTKIKIWPIGNLPTEQVWDATRASSSIWPSWLVHIFLPEEPTEVYASTLIGLALFTGCAGKSAQLPLYVWLPDAMAGPTPVSALIHAATMVTAGVYLVARLSFVFVMSPAAMAVVAVVGVFTAVFAATIGLLQTDLKKVLAYSTVSQLGYMFIGVGVGAFFAGFFHVFTHAFFKACLFLGAGSVIHAMHVRIHDTDASQDMRNMGGMRKYMKWTHLTFLVSTLSIAGLPLLSGFWSKDEILWKAFSVQIPAAGVETAMAGWPKDIWVWPTWLGKAIYVGGVLGALMTAFYMGRAYIMTFWGNFRGWTIVKGWKDPHAHDDHGHDDHDDHHHFDPTEPREGPRPKESPWAMTLPLIVLGTGAVFIGFIGAEPLFHLAFHKAAPMAEFFHYIFDGTERVVGERAGVEGLMLPMMLPGTAAGVFGGGGALLIYHYRKGAPEAQFKRDFPRLHSLIYDKWRIDELYDATVVGMIDALADIFVMADRWIIDGIIARLTAAIVAGTGSVLRLAQTGRVQVYSAAMAIGLLGMGWFFVSTHAQTSVDTSKLEPGGIVEVSAAPGLGYTYRWEADGVPEQKEFTKTPKVWVKLDPGQTKDVTLHVRNALGNETTTTVVVSRPGASVPTPRDATGAIAPRPDGSRGQLAPDGVRPAGGAR